MRAWATRRALNGLSDDLLCDIGLVRGEIPFVACAIASGERNPGRDMLDRLNESEARGRIPLGVLPARGLALALVLVAVASLCAAPSHSVFAQNSQIDRGKYLATLAGCHDCHTPGYFFGKPDMKRYLGGSEVGFEIPGLGVFHGPNLTPDKETGLGKWSDDEIGKAITTGKRPDGRELAPIMPWHAFANMTPDDVRAVVAFLQSLPPVSNKVPGPFGPSERPTSFVMKIAPPDQGAKDAATK